MRLKTIKLAGFKSFVDPTNAHFPTNLAAVVGPNGCGKSNIIDAVRWVMGESSAKHLRGESMTDVIFNGSSVRKPVGQAAIELVFDNADKSLGGEYAQYAEISIKRVVTREARSDYFLNGTRCRRKDITDIFLGTGLGPRSYAIIEQGMISRLIESKPEELRVYIEEAAGISKYKERRRETENRMRHTRENLARLSDIRDELGKQLAHLEKQARDAERYKELKEEERLLRDQLYALRWRALEYSVSQHEGQIRELETRLEAATASVREFEAAITRDREQQFSVSDEFNRVQSQYYQLGSDIARLQQSQRYQLERMEEINAAINSVESQREQAQQLISADRDALALVESELTTIAPQQALLEAEAEAANEQLGDAEHALNEWQQDWEQFQQHSQAPRQRAEVEQSRIAHQEQALQRGQERLARLETEQAGLSGGALETELAELNELAAEQQLIADDAQLRLDDTVQSLQSQRVALGDAGTRLDSLRQALQGLSGRESALRALQEASEKGQRGVNEWLQAHRIDTTPIAQSLRVTPGWERAVETVLGAQLHSVSVSSLDELSDQLNDLPQGVLSVAEAASAAPETIEGSLAAEVSGAPGWLLQALSQVRTATSLAEALAARHQLSAQASLITPEGLWLSQHWLRVHTQAADASSGELARRRELADLAAQRDDISSALDEAQRHQQQLRESLRDAEINREQQQRDVTAHYRQISDTQGQIGARQVRLEQFVARRDRILQEIDEVSRQTQIDREYLAEARLSLQEALDLMSNDTQRREVLLSQREGLRDRVDLARQAQRDKREGLHRCALTMQTLTARCQGLRDGLARVGTQVDDLRERRETMAEQLLSINHATSEDPQLLEALLEQHVETETQLSQLRDQVETLQAQLREAETGRVRAVQQQQSVRDSLNALRMEWQNVATRRDAQADLLHEAQADLTELLAQLPAQAQEAEWQLSLERVGQRVARLGAINLAAIDEFTASSERKVYLDQQDADLMEALETLENAIRKIDRETRALFKDTFEQVNNGLQALFPKVFGGGSAYLALTDDDLLEAGVSIMARPPGKKNSTIHLLSGGEKALTALSLVFSIFQLNPAPFCLLDEVDAPLDDANVARFARLVEEMSQQVQFIYITHNKIAMEMAKQLMGVTMQEPGVSRLVSVNVDEAAALANQ
ncbi:condensin subunit Smc [Paraperlucidibaca baekdonensis]|uniref:Chromosome partition protein Smc n=1 Tax=Paraperlucidibaca baekdonensis TaxID=748120 RepID=A0A3E0H2Y9_9GAMM|nr:chromosome segregation protein SMC [Paraperlucidibaca baekdonensis]REH36888.1 condensin subunit Smc [Paraperlucidibaca baekdonensis]